MSAELNEIIRREVAAGRARGGASCCGTTGVNHRWFCWLTPRDEAPRDLAKIP